MVQQIIQSMKKLIPFASLVLLLSACCETFESTPYCYVSGSEYGGYDNYYYEDYYYSNGQIEVGDTAYFRCEGSFNENSLAWGVEGIASLKGNNQIKTFDEARSYQYTVKYEDGCDNIQVEKNTFIVYDYKRESLEGNWKMVRAVGTCSSTNTNTTYCSSSDEFDSIPSNIHMEFKDRMVTLDKNGYTSSQNWSVSEEIAEGSYFNQHNIYGRIEKLTSDSLIIENKSDLYYNYETVTQVKTWSFAKVP